ncbi:MAG: N-acetylmuramoyl-L-alanine amidase [Bacteroidota bacterium]
MKWIVLLIFTFLAIVSFGQQKTENWGFNIQPSEIIDDSQNKNCPSNIVLWSGNFKISSEKELALNFHPSFDFTSFGVGIDPANTSNDCIDFSISYRVKKDNSAWCDWRYADFETSRDETETDLIWSELLFTPDNTPHNEVEIKISAKKSDIINKIRIDLMDISMIKQINAVPETEDFRPNGCPPFPSIIERSVWLDPYYGAQTYTPTVIYPTHVVIHHGASPDTYTDGAAVVRSYWNYHVNTLGWSDIGYNYLIDKYGNLYQGRKNSSMQTQDVRGAHAGASNDYSIGVNFLGNADVTLPTTVQLAKLHALLGWWFDWRGFDPTSSASMVLQSGGTGVLPRICGHKDTNVGGTACPGTTLYGMLPQIRIDTKAVIDACLTAPETSVSVTGNWQTDDFIANFSDDADGGLNTAFYQVLDNNGSEWRANGNFGFFNDNFDNILHPDWINMSGNWTINSGYLYQINEDSINTNLYIPANQTAGNIYLYHFSMKLGGSGTNRRAGIHFFCDDPTMIQRNNSYMVYFRADQNKCQIYKAVNDAITLYTDDNCTVNADTWYDYKVIFNTSTGEIRAYQNNTLVSSWTDSSPHSAGNSISLRTGNCNAFYNDMKIYRNRTATANITIGANEQVRYENQNPSTPSCRVKSIIVDNNNNWSPLEGNQVNIDWSQPSQVTVNDGISTDIDTTSSINQLTANWTASIDQNSGISEYFYCIGDFPGSNNIVDWTSNGINTTVTRTGLSLQYDSTYYFSVYAINGAGLQCASVNSDGILVVDGSSVGPQALFYAYDTLLYLPSASAIFFNLSSNAISYTWDFGDGTSSTDANPWHQYQTTGIYTVILIAHNSTYQDDTLELIDYIHVLDPTSSELIENGFYIYPNPFTDYVNVESSFGIKKIIVYDLFGRKIYNDSFDNNNNVRHLIVDLCEFPAGVYSTYIETSTINKFFKLIKK